MPRIHHFLGLCALILIASKAQAVTLASDQTDYVTTEDITTSGVGISSTLTGLSSDFNTITNLHVITTGNSGATSSAYGIKTTKSYNKITNGEGASITTTGSSGRGISVVGSSSVSNLGAINTQGTTSYGIYVGGSNSSVSNSGSITTINSDSYGIYLNGSNNSAENTGSIATKDYGIYANGNVNSLSNSGTITTTDSGSAHGIFMSAGSASTASASSYSTINNSGTINASGNGIYVKDAYSQITNSGAISSAAGSSIYGIKTEGDNSIINNFGSVSSTTYAIYNSGQNSVINNSGNLTGGVFIGAGVLNIFGGSISGTVEGGASGLVNIGSNANPAIIFNQTGAFSGLSSLNINAGSTLNSYAAITADEIFIDENSKLFLSTGSSVNGIIKGTSSASGTLEVSETNFTATGIGAETNYLKNLNIINGGSLTASSNIYANNIFLNGDLNFNGADNLTILGKVSGSGSGGFNVGSKNQTINGDFSLTNGDKFGVTIENASVGKLAIIGAAALPSGTKLGINIASNMGYIASGSKFNLIETTDGSAIDEVSGENIWVNNINSNIYGLLKFTTEKNANNLVLTISRLAPTDVTQNKNFQNIYQNLNEISAHSSGKLLDFQIYLNSSGLMGPALDNALNQLAPQSSKATLAVSSNMVNHSIDFAESRLKNFSEGLWVRPFAVSADQNAVKDDDGYSANSVGLVVGADKGISYESAAGAALSYSRSNVKSTDGAKKNLITAYQLSLYNGHNFNKYFFDYLAAFAYNQYSSERSIEALKTNGYATYAGQIYALKTKAGIVQKISQNSDFIPELSFTFLRNEIGAYSEKGADSLSLNVQKVSADFFEARLGAAIDSVAGKIADLPEFNKFISSLKISYGYAFINDAPTTVSSFDGQSSTFETKISSLDSASLKIGTALTAYYLDDLNFNLAYEFEGRATYQAHSASLNIRQKF